MMTQESSSNFNANFDAYFNWAFDYVCKNPDKSGELESKVGNNFPTLDDDEIKIVVDEARACLVDAQVENAAYTAGGF